MWALVPLKNLENVKTRLAPVLSQQERVELFLCMVRDVLVQVAAAQCIDGLLVVTRDAQLGETARSYGAHVLEEPANEGHSAAVAFGAHWLIARGHQSFVQLPADIPMIKAEELSRVVAAHEALESSRKVTIVPSHDYGGSNCIACTPPDALELQFGIDSFRRHMNAVRHAGIGMQVHEEAGIALDIDDPQDLARLAAMPVATDTQRFLVNSGIARRLGEYRHPAAKRMAS